MVKECLTEKSRFEECVKGDKGTRPSDRVFKAEGIGSTKAMKQKHAQQRRAAKRSVCPGLSEAESDRIQVQ